MATQKVTETKTHNEYTVGWVCALPKEQTAATAMLDQRHGALPKHANDSNTYTLGSIGKHNVVIACLPKGHIGNTSAATVATQMVSTFTSIRFGLVVGIGGGIPPKVRLGDVVVSTPIGSFPGVVQWDLGKAKDGGFERTGSLNNPPSSLLTAITALETEHDLVGSKIPEYLDEMKQKWPRVAAKYLKSDLMKDILFKADYNHVDQATTDCDVTLNDDDEGDEEEESCRFCDKAKVIKRKPRDMRVHYGLIASGNQVIKSATYRDKLNKDLGGHLLCVEMEAAGLMNNFPCIIIRGICDYADSHKNKDWQEYAAAVASAFAKELLDYVQPSDVDGERTVKEILDDVITNVSATRLDVSHIKSDLDGDKKLQILDWITSIDYGPQQSDFFKRRQPGTGQWLLDSAEYQTWFKTGKQTLFCPGIPGAGKTILTSIVVDYLERIFKADPTISIAYIYCNYKRQEEQPIEKLLASLLKQLSRGQQPLPNCVRDMHNQHNDKRTRPSLSEIIAALHLVAEIYSKIFIIVDALDECQNLVGCRQAFIRELFMLQGKCEVNLFITSRFIPEIVDRFKTASVSLEIRASTKDIRRYLKGHIGQLPMFVQQNQKLQQEVVTGISEAVDGMFLLAQIYLSSLSDKVTPKAIKIALKGLQKPIPGSNEVNQVEVLAHAYEQAMLRINQQQSGFKDLANKVLSWIICAERQLTKTELQYALAVEVNEPELDEENLPSIQDMVSVCAGLVTIDGESNIIRLVHYTTQEYFNQTRQRWFPDAEVIMADICAAYLMFKDFESGPCQNQKELKDRLQSNPLYDYAAQNWGHHARKASIIRRKVMEFLECDAKMNASVEILKAPAYFSSGFRGENPVRRMTKLHLAAYFGIEETTRVLLEKTIDVNAKDDNGQTPLSWSACNGHVVVVKLLLAVPSVDTGSKDQHNSSFTPLQLAAWNGHEDVVKLLLTVPSIGINSINAALSEAARNGHAAVVQLLLAAGADLSAVDNRSQPMLFELIERGYEAVIKLLLTAGADPKRPGRDGKTALSVAAYHGNDAAIKLLLATRNINVNIKDDLGRAPLHMAALRGHEAVIRLLLAVGADIDLRDTACRTALVIAIDMGRTAVVRLLLASGADPDLGGKLGRIPLLIAVQRWDKPIIEMLITAGAELDLKNVLDPIMRLFLKIGHFPNGAVINALLIVGAELKWIAKEYGHKQTIEVLFGFVAQAGLLGKDANPPKENVDLIKDAGLVDEDSKTEPLTSAGAKRKRKYEKIT
ncbi:hypothetical protein TrVFT333_007205 [Trichoderma virens FT-333]|nr:hypothetical protein TrVFT333_007205 [Trichoderma virens FT-333]